MADRHEVLETFKLEPADLEDEYLRNMQQRFDAMVGFPPYTLTAKRPTRRTSITLRDSKIANITQSVGLALGNLSFVAKSTQNKRSSILRKDVLPQVLVARTRLANILGFDLEEKFQSAVIRGNTFTEVGAHLQKADLELGRYIEPLGRLPVDVVQRDKVRDVATPSLHAASVILGRMCGLEPATIHIDYLAGQVQESST